MSTTPDSTVFLRQDIGSAGKRFTGVAWLTLHHGGHKMSLHNAAGLPSPSRSERSRGGRRGSPPSGPSRCSRTSTPPSSPPSSASRSTHSTNSAFRSVRKTWSSSALGIGKTHLAISLTIAAAQSAHRVYRDARADLLISLEESQDRWPTGGIASRSSPTPRSLGYRRDRLLQVHLGGAGLLRVDP